ncbi:hypothetical protein [Streptomyces sp. LMG1-1-1.1]|uniref:hypothetical protein n=1 Tax=Streptomyces sp. LMG1-1-1.1 TaxID=3135245 RepID=UPI0034678221
MAAHNGLRALTAAAALATAVLFVRRRVIRTARGPHDAGAAEASWRPAASPPDGEGPAPDRVAVLHASFSEPALREADAHLEQCWNKLASLYPHREG